MQQIYTTHRGRIHNPVGRALDCRAGGGGFDFPNRNNTQGLEIKEKWRYCLCPASGTETFALFGWPCKMAVPSTLEDVKIVTSISAFMQNTLTLKISAFVVKLPTLFCSIDLLEMIMNTSCGWEMIYTPINTHSGITSDYRTPDLASSTSSPSWTYLRWERRPGKRTRLINYCSFLVIWGVKSLWFWFAWCWIQWALPRFLTWTRKRNNARTICTFAKCEANEDTDSQSHEILQVFLCWGTNLSPPNPPATIITTTVHQEPMTRRLQPLWKTKNENEKP